MTAPEFVARLEHVTKTPRGWTGRCPAHEDHKNSLSVDEGEDRRVLVKCFAGCTALAIVEAMGLSMSDLFPDSRKGRSGTGKQVGKIEAAYDFVDETGELLYQEVRYEPKDFKLRRPNGKDGWVWHLDCDGNPRCKCNPKLPPVRRVLLNLPAVQKATSVLAVEGPKDCRTAERLGFVATTNAMGAKAPWLPEYSETLRGKRVCVIADADAPGLAHGREVARSLLGVAESVRLIEALPGVPDKGDLTDYVRAGATRESLQQLIDEAPELTPADAAQWIDDYVVENTLEARTENPGDNAERDSAATKLVRLSERMELFHDAMREGYATVQVDTHRETMRIASRRFRQHLSLQYFVSESKAPSPHALATALATIEAKALFEGAELAIHTRVAEEHGAIHLDLCNPTWQAVRITEKGWEVVSNAQVKFVRGPGMLPLPMPARGGSFHELDRFTTLQGEGLTLLKGYMLGILREGIPYPILALIGEHGSGKTTLTRLVKRMIDPSKAPARGLPKDERDLMIAAETAHIVALDSLSHIDGRMSDAICRLSTGGGLATRSLFTDRDETIFDCQRPVIVNAITDVLGRSDLLDRVLMITVPGLDDSKKKAELDFWQEFDKAHPFLLGALCAAAARALRERAAMRDPAVRMVDFARFVMGGEEAIGLKRGDFLEAYETNRKEVNQAALDSSTVAQVLKQFLENRKDWKGTAGELLGLLTPIVSDAVRRSREWPKSPRGLSGAVRRLVPNLRRVGITIDVDFREGGTGRRLIEIKRTSVGPSQPSPSSQENPTVTEEASENEPDTRGRDGCDGCDGREAAPESVTVDGKGDTEWEA
jgi:hypothetical protein